MNNHLNGITGMSLPGPSAWKLMLPPYIDETRQLELRPKKEGEKDAAVLILLHSRGGMLSFPLLERPSQMRHHAGQIALPGGALEPNEAAIDAALRETWEELGVAVEAASVQLSLSPIFALPSNYWVYPFMALVETTPPYTLNQQEASSSFEVPLSALLDSSSQSTFPLHRNGRLWEVPCFRFEDRIVWGLTAMILAEFAQLAAKLT
jgi:8-oxo-dGTP pyrophosphatase MutT (NUDIX family)